MHTTLSAETWARTMRIHDAGIADSTRKNYARGFERYQEWAASERVDAVMPIPEAHLCAFAASFAGNFSAGAARSAMSGLRFYHDTYGLRWSGSARLARILDSVGNMAPEESRRDPRPPVTQAMLDEALHKLDPLRPFDQCVAAAMLVAFWGQLRLGEVLSLTRRYDLDRMPCVRHVKFRADLGGATHRETTAIWLPRTKTARRGEWAWISRQFNDPSRALCEHIKASKLLPDDPLFAYRDDRKKLIPLTKNAFLSRLNEIWIAAGMCRISGHCFRIGGTTALLRAGIDTEVVKLTGRWKSDSFLRYWRSVDRIVSSHVDLCDLLWSGED